MATLTEIPATALPSLSNDEIARYSRHLLLPEVGMEGQQKLKAAKVLCVGTGGLGSPLAFYLAAAGVGTLGLVDFDVVDSSNLQRQIIHSTKDVGRLEAGLGRREAEGPEPVHEDREVQHHVVERQRHGDLQGLRHRGRRHR